MLSSFSEWSLLFPFDCFFMSPMVSGGSSSCQFWLPGST